MCILITSGNVYDSTQAENLLHDTIHKKAYVVGDKAFDSEQLLNYIEEKGAISVIPPRKNRKEQRKYDKVIYKNRNQIERFFNRLKQFRRIATRYDKLLLSFLSLVQLAVVFITIPKFSSIVQVYPLEFLQKVLFAPRASKQIVKLMKEYRKTTLKQQQQELKQLKTALERTEKGLSNIIETIAVAGIPSDTLMEKLKQLEESKVQQKERIAELEKSIKNINIDENIIQNLIEHSREFIMTKNLPVCKNILKEYIKKVVVSMDKVEIYFKLNIIEQQELSVISLPMTAEEDIDTIKKEYKSLLKQ